MELSNQILARHAILTKANKEILQAHVFHCVLNADEQKQEKLQEVNALLDKLL